MGDRGVYDMFLYIDSGTYVGGETSSREDWEVAGSGEEEGESTSITELGSL